MTTFWSIWITAITLIFIGGICWLLFANRKGKNTGPDNTTGHVYDDDIAEYDNPLPAWWFNLFLITIVFAAGYLLAYPGLGKFAGLLGWTQENALQRDIDHANAVYGPLFAKYAQMPIEEVSKDKQAVRMGQRLFADNCAQCHGVDAHGSYGFPNLTDNDWLYGGKPEQILESITKGRIAAMPAWEAALGDSGVQQVGAYVTTLSGRKADPALAAEGGKKFAMFCVGCHGADGKGSLAFGAPNLTDGIWLYGGSPMQIQQTIIGGRNGQMPVHENRLSPEKIHLLAAYVFSLSQNASLSQNTSSPQNEVAVHE